MAGHARLIQVIFLVLAIGLIIVGGMLQKPIQQQSLDAELITQESAGVLKQNPELGVLTAIPGGLRVLGVNVLWIRSQELHQEGRHYDALQMAEMICQLQPYHPGVWAFQAWNMAWNISVTCKTPEERWKWVYNGVELLRDRALVYNPRSLPLYKELSWIFFSKMGGMLDDQHLSYKERWAGIMQNLLGAPPFDNSLKLTLAEETDTVIEAFRKIAQAPLDKSPERQGRDIIQKDKLKELMQDPAVSDYAKRLAEKNIFIDDTMLSAYNQFSLDYAADCMRIVPPALTTENDKAISQIINDPQSAEAREKILSFVRAQILWNKFRMDPAFMLGLMEKYKIPLDWRHTMSHALYWAELGMVVCKIDNPRQKGALNNARNVLNSLKTMTATGMIAMGNRPQKPLYPYYYESADLRYIEPSNQQHLAYIDQILKNQESLPKSQQKEFDKNILKSGHVNYLEECIRYLVADGRVAQAQKYFDFIRDKYKMKGPDWDFDLVEDFVIHNMTQEGSPRYVVVKELLDSTLKRAFISRGLYDNEAEYRKQLSLALRIYKAYQNKAVDRMKMHPDFNFIAGIFLMELLQNPRKFGLSLDLQQLSDIYTAMNDQPQMQIPAYLRLEIPFKRFCDAEKLDMNKAFPKPPGLEEYRKKLQEKLVKPTGQNG